jgi:PD-(D/E)XK nuclease superfamily
MLTLSQAHFSLLDACPREFQYRILDRLSAPIDPEQQARLVWGALFHRLIEQASLGLDVDALLVDRPEFARPLAQLRRSTGLPWGELFANDSLSNYYSEHSRQLNLGGFGLIGVYDGLWLTADRAEILDWKSYAKPRRPEALADHWQTRLYRYLLVETSDYQPEQVVMTYWFVGSSESDRGQADRGQADREQPAPEFLRLIYDDRQHGQTHRDLLARLGQLDRWLRAYEGSEALLDQVADRSRCGTCAFVSRCGRDRSPELDWQSLPEIEP